MLTMLETYRQHQAHGLAETRDVANLKKVEGAEEQEKEEKEEAEEGGGEQKINFLKM
jgi:hypothetical protein